MNFASPDRLLWLLVAIPIVLFYLLKTKPKRHQVSTLLFWEQLFDQKRQRAWWQRLRHPLSLLLQLIFVGLIVGSLLDPLWSGQEKQSRKLVMVIDNSASMQALGSSGKSRFDEAIQAAHESLRELRGGDEMGIVTAGSTVEVVVGLTDFTPALDEAIDHISVTDGPTNLTAAIELARRLCGDAKQHQLLVYSDGCDAFDATVREAKDVSWTLVGESVDNIGITAFQARRSLADPIGYAALIEVQNKSDKPQACRLTIKLDESLVDVIPLTLSPLEKFHKTIQEASREGGLLVASLDIDDGLAIDNEARTVITPCEPIPVTLVTDRESVYLQKVLEAIPLVELTVTSRPPAQSPPRGFTVFHGTVPAQLPSGAVMVIDPAGDGEYWKIGQAIESAIVIKQSESSPIMAHVRLINVTMPGGRPVELPETAEALLTTTDGGVLMASLVHTHGRLLVMGTSIDNGELPLRIAFPILMTNAVNWFLGRTGEMPKALATGEVAIVPVGAVGVDRLQYVDPLGKSHPLLVRDDAVSVGPVSHTGVLTIQPANADRSDAAVADVQMVERLSSIVQENPDTQIARVAVNLANASESDLRRPAANESLTTLASQHGGRHSIWIYLCAVALGLMVGEWFLYQRRIVG